MTVLDRTLTIRASVSDIERTLVHLRDAGGPGGLPLPAQCARHVDSRRRRAGLADRHLRRDVPGGFSLDNLSLMALAIASGFVVDDAIVVMENITRHLEEGMTPTRGRAQGRAGDRLHGLLHQRFADRGVHSASC